jgi:hypothetical protein
LSTSSAAVEPASRVDGFSLELFASFAEPVVCEPCSVILPVY